MVFNPLVLQVVHDDLPLGDDGGYVGRNIKQFFFVTILFISNNLI